MKNRLITAYTEIQADQLNDLQEYNKDNFRILINDIVGCTSGTARGLETSIISAGSRTIAVTSGVVCDGNGVFYELPASGSVTLPNVDGTYKIYALQGSATGEATSGYVLLDIESGIEDYQTIYRITYDALSISSTVGTIPANSHLIAISIVSGGSITSLVDGRTFVQLGDLISNSLDGMSLAGDTTTIVANQITGTVQKRSGKYPFIETLIDNAYAGVAIDIINGSNASTTGIAITTNGNTGFRSTGTGTGFRGNNTIGFDDTSSSIGFRSTATTGFVGTGNISFKSTGTSGFVSTGTNGFISESSTIGYTSNSTVNSAVHFLANVNSTSAVGYQAKVKIGTGLQILKDIITTNTLNGLEINSVVGDNTSTFAKGIDIKNSVKGVEIKSPDITNSTGLVIVESFEQESVGIDLYNLKTGMNIYNSVDGQTGIKIVKNANGGSLSSNYGIIIQQNYSSIGINLDNDSANTDLIGINFTGNQYATVIGLEGCYKKGISLEAGQTNTSGIVIKGEGTYSTYEVGIELGNLTNPINIKNATDGIIIDNCSDRGINILNSDIAVNIFNTVATSKTAININNAETGIAISSTTSGITIATSAKGIFIQSYTTKGIEIDHVDDKSHLRLIPSPNTLPSNDEQLGDILVKEDGTTTKLYLYGNVSGTPTWREVQFV